MGAGLGNILAEHQYALVTAAGILGIIGWTLVTVRRMERGSHGLRRRLSELEVQLNEAETAIAAEAHVLVIWRGRAGEPDRVLGSMHGTAQVPENATALMDLPSWLEPDSAETLAEAINALRETGASFNIGIRTHGNELLEADGRTAGGFATLRLRPLAGQRREVTELAYDARKLSKQVERLSAVLDASPLPIWLRDGEEKLIWVNQAYVRAVDAPDSGTVLRGGIDIFSEAKIDRIRANSKAGCRGRTHTIINGAMRALDIYEIDLVGGRAGFAIDMSALEEAERELDRHIKAHASTLNKLDTAIAIFGPDQRIRFYNAAYAALWPIDGAWLDTSPTDGEILDRLRAQRCIPEQANYREWRNRQLSAYTTLEVRENWWYLPDGRSLHVVCEQHPFGGVTYLYENATKEIQLESRYNSLIGVQRETLDNLEEGVALFGAVIAFLIQGKY